MHDEGDPHEAEHGSRCGRLREIQADLTDASSDCMELCHIDVTWSSTKCLHLHNSHNYLYLIHIFARLGYSKYEFVARCSHGLTEIPLKFLELGE
jgi:hypothetical protein